MENKNNTVFSLLNKKETLFPFQLYGVSLNHDQKHIVRKDGFPALLWLQTREGTGRVAIDGNELALNEHNGIWIFPNKAHEIYADEGDWIVDWVAFSGQGALDFLARELEVTESASFEITDSKLLLDLMKKLAQVELSDETMKEYRQTIIIYEFLINFLRVKVISTRNSLDTRYQRLKPVFDYIDKHYHESFTLKQLADLLEITPQHLCTLFRKIMRTRIFEYVNLIRIKKSKEQLVREPEVSIRDIAYSNGFEDVSYYCYIFKRNENMTPGEFRKINVH